MNNTQEREVEPKLVYAGFFGCIVVLGLPLNALSLWILLRHHCLKSPSAVYMVNLALSDLLLAFSLPMRIYFYATGTWPLGSLACNLITVFFRNNIRSSTFFITLISVDRLLAVVYPLRSRHLRTTSNAWKAAGAVWLFVLVLSIPESVSYLKFLRSLDHSTCFESAKDHTSKRNINYIQPVLVFTMLAVNIVCTALVSWTLSRHLSDSARVKNKVKVMLIFVMGLVMFTVCFLPLYVGILITKASSVKTPLILLASMNCCLDPLLYYFSLDAFWKKKEDVVRSRGQQL